MLPRSALHSRRRSLPPQSLSVQSAVNHRHHHPRRRRRRRQHQLHQLAQRVKSYKMDSAYLNLQLVARRHPAHQLRPQPRLVRRQRLSVTVHVFPRHRLVALALLLPPRLFVTATKSCRTASVCPSHRLELPHYRHRQLGAPHRPLASLSLLHLPILPLRQAHHLLRQRLCLRFRPLNVRKVRYRVTVNVYLRLRLGA